MQNLLLLLGQIGQTTAQQGIFFAPQQDRFWFLALIIIEHFAYLFQSYSLATSGTAIVVHNLVMGHPAQPGQLQSIVQVSQHLFLLHRGKKYFQRDILSIFNRENLASDRQKNGGCVPLIEEGNLRGTDLKRTLVLHLIPSLKNEVI